MKKAVIFISLEFVLVNIPSTDAFSWVTNGSASISGNEIIVTPAAANQTGSFWSETKLDLTQNFDLSFKTNFGNISSGADGISFVLQNAINGTSALGNPAGGGEWIGMYGIYPAVAVEIDSFQNSNRGDPTYDHLGVDEYPSSGSGVPNHSGAAPVAAMSRRATIKDGVDHTLRVVWNAAAKSMTVYFDGVLKITYTKDIVSTFFSGNSQVYWGFTGSTGSDFNKQYVIAYTTISSFKTATSSYTVSGSTVTYTMKIINTGGITASVSQIQDLLPGNFSYISGSSSGSISTNPSINGQSLTWSTPFEIQPTSTSTFIFQAKAGTTSGTFYNNYTLAGVDFTIFSSGDTAPVTVITPILTMTKTADKTTYAPGETITYTVKYQNLGKVPASTLIITDTVPSNTNYTAGSLKIGVSSTTYSNANPLTDAADGDAGEISGSNVIFRINSVGANNGVSNSGNDEGNVFFRVKVK